jgi:hypothetical protein
LACDNSLVVRVHDRTSHRGELLAVAGVCSPVRGDGFAKYEVLEEREGPPVELAQDVNESAR